MDENKKVKEMHEKPQNPPTHYAVPPFYIYNKRDLDIIRTSVENGCGHDAPGSLVSWLCRRTDVFAWEIHGNRYDVGDIKSYNYVKQIFEDK
jgi:glucose-1-phosphate thymidylyltransferase